MAQELIGPGESFESVITGVVTAEVTHNAPCVPECPVCYPEGEDR